MRILLHCLHGHGGLAEHAHYQARAFLKRGDEILVLCPDDYLQGRPVEYRIDRAYRSLRAQNKSGNALRRLFSTLRRTAAYLLSQWKLVWYIVRFRPDMVLLDSYMEYLSPLWVWPHLMLAKLGVTKYAANLHDPVRDFVVGPLWWHKLSVALAYSPLRVVVVHETLSDASVIPKHITAVEAPVGVYDLRETPVDPGQVRRAWGVPQDATVLLSFGFIRDNKNIDLLIKALPENPNAVLVVMGSAQSSTNKPLEFYRSLARDLGVENRVVFREEFVPDEALGGYFQAADFIALTYNAHFHSQSGVLNIAARARKPVLASSGESPLKNCVEKFRLGLFIKPDNPEEVRQAVAQMCARKAGGAPFPAADWDGYISYASWDSNVGAILEAVRSLDGRVTGNSGQL